MIYLSKRKEGDGMKLLESAEDYLERILMIQEKNGNVRSIDIANDMNYSKPSVSIAMHKLKENGYIEIESNGTIVLTKEGYAVATRVYERHRVISSFLVLIGVDKEQALIDACKIEHDISEETFERLKKFMAEHK